MKIVVWARVSSREQREGYSIDAQVRAMRDRAARNGWNIIREFVVAESAKRGAERQAFNEMFDWVSRNAKREGINAILSHKLDRICRNMRDAVRLQGLEDDKGVKLLFVDNEFGGGAAGALSFNVMAAVAQYYSDNLRAEVIKGLDEKAKQGWGIGTAPFGYVNAKDKNEPIQPDPEQARTLQRIFELYATNGYTLDSLSDKLQQEGHRYRPSHPRFSRTCLSYLLTNRFYVGEVRRHGNVYEGKHRLLIDRKTFAICQDILKGKNRRTTKPNLPLGGGILRCGLCGQSMTPELIHRKLLCGGVRDHLYYRCANNRPHPDHPKVRWTGEQVERAITSDLDSMRIRDLEVASWFRTAIQSALEDMGAVHAQQATMFRKRQTELAQMQDRLLTAYLAGTVDEAVFQAKSAALKSELLQVQESLEKVGKSDPARPDLVFKVFDWSQDLANTWRRSNSTQKREILDTVYSNRALTDVSLVTTKRKPFDALAEGLSIQSSRGDRI